MWPLSVPWHFPDRGYNNSQLFLLVKDTDRKKNRNLHTNLWNCSDTVTSTGAPLLAYIVCHIFSASNAQSMDMFTHSMIVLVGVEWALNLLCDITRNLQFTLSSLFSTLFYRTVKQWFLLMSLKYNRSKLAPHWLELNSAFNIHE